MESELDAVFSAIQELHTYDVPEILTFDVGRGEQTFLDWMAACVDKSAPFPDADDDEDPHFPDAD
jgi:hypothetical protein